METTKNGSKKRIKSGMLVGGILTGLVLSSSGVKELPKNEAPNELVDVDGLDEVVVKETEFAIERPLAEVSTDELRVTYSSELDNQMFRVYYVDANRERYINFKLKHQNYKWTTVMTRVNLRLDYADYTKIETVNQPKLITTLVTKHRTLPSSYAPSRSKVSSSYSTKTLYLQTTAKTQFEKMCAAAKKDGISLKAISAYRSYDYQDNLYWSKADPDDLASIIARDKVSARPGHSEHQLGLAADINSLSSSFDKTSAFRWLQKNAANYGFILRLPKDKTNVTRYSYEPWHWRYVGVDLAKKVKESGMTYDEYYAKYIDPEMQMSLIQDEAESLAKQKASLLNIREEAQNALKRYQEEEEWRAAQLKIIEEGLNNIAKARTRM